jgi:hypothetical protein
MCTGCKSFERTRLVWLVLTELLGERKSFDAVHFAPEAGIARRLNAICGMRYRAFDYDPSRYPLGFMEVEKADLCERQLTIQPGSQDLVLHNHVMEHVPCNPWRVMRCLTDLLRPGGLHVFSLPIIRDYYSEDMDPRLTAEERVARFGQDDHMRMFGRLDLRNALIDEFGKDPHFAHHTRLDERMLTAAGVPTSALSGINSHTVFVFRKT